MCEHMNFKANVRVGRLTDGGMVTGYCADVTIQCADCGLPFRFIGLDAGNHHAEPRVSVDGIELRAPLEPATHEKFAPRASYTVPSRRKYN
jgi:hypothetical protein